MSASLLVPAHVMVIALIRQEVLFASAMMAIQAMLLFQMDAKVSQHKPIQIDYCTLI